MSVAEEKDVEDLKVSAIIGFDGAAIGGLKVHPDGKHVVYPIGNKITILHWRDKTQAHLAGHTNVISAIDLSRSGKYVASGQINHIGFKALVIVWCFEKRSIVSKHEVHKVRVEAVSFSKDELYLVSLGGRDCCSVVVWDIVNKKPLCGATSSKETQGEATIVCPTNCRGACFATGGDGNLTVWRIDHRARKLHGTDVNVSKLKRNILCMTMSAKDEIMYCGTSTGDVLKIRLNYHHDPDVLDPVHPPVMVGCYTKLDPCARLVQDRVQLYSMGVRCILILSDETLLIGAGDGTVDVVAERTAKFKGSLPLKMPTTPQLSALRSTRVGAAVTSMSLLDASTALVGTADSEVFSLELRSLELQLLVTCHVSAVFDLAFPHDYSEVFATAGKGDVRVWHLDSARELLRIRVPNFCCSSVLFAHDGRAILTGWNDGVIRAFTPLTGRPVFELLDAHNKGVSALAATRDDRTLISGGCEGQVRIWAVGPLRQQLVCTLKEHKGPVSAIHVSRLDDEAVSASTDGTCIIWDIVRRCRKQILFANTLFMCVRYFPSGVQILTGGSDRKVAYWEVFDGSLIREQEGSTSAAINALDISPDGAMFCTGGNDQVVKLWRYQEGVITHVGLGHSAVVTALRFSPDGRKLVSASASGSVFIWDCPFDVSAKPEPPPQPAPRCADEDLHMDEHVKTLCTRGRTQTDRTKNRGK